MIVENRNPADITRRFRHPSSTLDCCVNREKRFKGDGGPGGGNGNDSTSVDAVTGPTAPAGSPSGVGSTPASVGPQAPSPGDSNFVGPLNRTDWSDRFPHNEVMKAHQQGYPYASGPQAANFTAPPGFDPTATALDRAISSIAPWAGLAVMGLPGFVMGNMVSSIANTPGMIGPADVAQGVVGGGLSSMAGLAGLGLGAQMGPALGLSGMQGAQTGFGLGYGLGQDADQAMAMAAANDTSVSPTMSESAVSDVQGGEFGGVNDNERGRNRTRRPVLSANRPMNQYVAPYSLPENILWPEPAPYELGYNFSTVPYLYGGV